VIPDINAVLAIWGPNQSIVGNAEKRFWLLKEGCRVQEHFSGAKVFDNIANLKHLGKLPADES
jgi:hypothetical protein